MSDQILLSIVIPCRNEENYIEKCLDSIYSQTIDKSAVEVIIADGASTDSTAGIIEKFRADRPDARVKVVMNDKIYTPFALNLGIKNSRGKYVIILGAHSHLKEDFLEKCLETIESHPECDVIGGKIISVSSGAVAEAISAVLSSRFGVGNARFRYSDEPGYVDTVAFGTYRREIFDKIGYFDEELIRNQDDEFNYRILKNGSKVYFNPEIISYYYTRPTIKGLIKQYYGYGYYKVKVFKKVGSQIRARHLAPALFAAYITLLAGAKLSGVKKTFLTLPFFIYLLAGAIFTAFNAFSEKKPNLALMFFLYPIVHLSYGFGTLANLMTCDGLVKTENAGENKN